MGIKWRGIQNIRWNKELIEEVKEYLKDGSIPKRVEDNYMRSWRFKKLFSQFTLGDDNNIYVIVNEEEDLPSYFLDENGDLLFDVNLPMKFRLIETQKEKEEIIQTYYSNLLGNAYRSSTNLHQRLMKEFINISRKDVNNTLKNLEIKQLIHPIEENKITKPIITEKPFQQWECDLIDVSSISKQNDNVNFILTVVDIFSKYSFCEILKNKSAKSVAYSMQQIILRFGSPQIISCDNGAEFSSTEFIELCQRFNIKLQHSLPYKPTSQGAVEKFNQTLKNYMFRYMTEHKSKRYVDNLQLFCYSYNTTQHSTTKHTPYEVMFKRHESYKMLNDLVHKNISDNAKKMIENSLKNQQAMKEELDIGDKVRVGLLFLKENRRKQNKIMKKNKQHWSSEIYDIEEIIDNDGLLQYKINIPLKSEENRLFYRHQLLKIIPENLVKRKNVQDKFDYNFGNKFDTELHIKTLAKNTAEKNALEIPQEELDEILDLEASTKGLAPETGQEKDLEKRVRKQTDKGFFVSF
jgi:transposase InsO family protein